MVVLMHANNFPLIESSVYLFINTSEVMGGGTSEVMGEGQRGRYLKKNTDAHHV